MSARQPPLAEPRSALVTLGDLVEERVRFQVPLYQRLYVWGTAQVDTLLHDLWMAFEADAPVFYLGGCLVVERTDDDGPILELIDGQQRFTTLWMMSLAWRGPLEPFGWLDDSDLPRVSFSIRAEVDAFFRAVRHSQAIPKDFPHAAMRAAQAHIGGFLEAHEQAGTDSKKQRDFLRWVWQRVQLVLTRMPEKMDLNQLYEVINSRGQQLRHHDILKARLLGRLSDAERHGYAQLWEACSNLDGWVDRSLRAVSGLRVRDLLPPRGRPKHRFASADTLLRRLGSSTHRKRGELDLATILAEPDSPPSEPAAPLPETADTDEVRSILSFPLLLQHTLRIWLHEHGHDDLPRIADKELLHLFEHHFLHNASRADIRSFVKLLWSVRVRFDEHVVKWVRRGDDEQLTLYDLRITQRDGQPAVQRTVVALESPAPMLQAMLYHSQQITTHYWLTPLLAYLHRYQPGSADALAYLRHLDNHLLCRRDGGSLVERTRQHLDDTAQSWQRFPLCCSDLEEPRGTGMPHYWFYKIEFLLWDNRTARGLAKRCNLPEAAVRSFRITARSSVEHISPQTPQAVDRHRVSGAMLHRLGNLALVSRSINSEYGNLPFNEKRQRFINRNKGRVDSLKLALIYRHGRWNDRLAREHEAEVVALVKDYLERDFSRKE